MVPCDGVDEEKEREEVDTTTRGAAVGLGSPQCRGVPVPGVRRWEEDDATEIEENATVGAARVSRWEVAGSDGGGVAAGTGGSCFPRHHVLCTLDPRPLS